MWPGCGPNAQIRALESALYHHASTVSDRVWFLENSMIGPSEPGWQKVVRALSHEENLRVLESAARSTAGAVLHALRGTKPRVEEWRDEALAYAW